MNKLVTVAFLICMAPCSLVKAQSKIEKYCDVEISRKIKISFGSAATFSPKDTLVIQKLRQVTQLKTESDVLNYMTALGWVLVNIHSAGLYTATEVIYFKKEFDSAEFIEDH